MATFFIKLDGAQQREIEVDTDTVEEARDRAIMTLGAYLQKNPGYADHRQWRVDIQDASRRHLMYIVVACVEAAPRPNLASYESSPSNGQAGRLANAPWPSGNEGSR